MGKRPLVIYVYKDFNTFNGLIDRFIFLSRNQACLPYDFELLVFGNKKNDYVTVFRNNGGKLINLGFKWGSNPLILLKLVRVLKKKGPDVVQTFILKPNIFGIIAAKLAGVPVIIATEVTLTNQAPTAIKRLRDKVLYKIYKQVTRWADHVVCVSEAVKNEFMKLGIYCGSSVIYPPLDIEKVLASDQENMRKPEKLENQLVMGIVARLSEEKRHIDLLEAFSIITQKYNNLRLIIVGDGPLRNSLERMARKLKIDDKVDFTGFQKNVLKYLHMMDIFILPSRTEGLPRSTIEAMACSLPVVATRVGGLPEIVDDQVNGILIDCARVDQLVSAVAVLIEDKDKRKEYGRRGKEKVFHLFSFDKYVKEHYSLYVSILKKKQELKSVIL